MKRALDREVSLYFNELLLVVESYANSYNDAEKLHKKYANRIPKGDQKTGVFGEAFIMEYIYRKYGNAFLTQHSTTSKDIKYFDHYELETHVEVKTVSAFSEGRIMSPIGDKWDELYMVSLNKEFLPNGVWKVLRRDLLFCGPTSTTTGSFTTQYKSKNKNYSLWKMQVNDSGDVCYKIKQANLSDLENTSFILNPKGRFLASVAKPIMQDVSTFLTFK